MDMAAFINALPKAEMHVHLEGTIPWSLARMYSDEDLPEIPDWLHDEYRFADFADFGTLIFQSIRHVLLTPERYFEIAGAYFQGLVQQNVRYVEVSISVNGTLSRGLKGPEVVDAVLSAVPPGLIVRIIAGINRRWDVKLGSDEAEFILETPGIVGLDLAGDERLNVPEAFKEIFQAAGEKDYLLRAHAGELTGPDIIRRSIDVLNLSRIEHGTSAQGD